MLLDLPTELVVQIFSNLSLSDLVSCQLACKYLLSVVQDNVSLQYHMALIAAKASDNPCSILPVATKLLQLRNGDKAWAVLKPTFTMTIPVEHNPSGIYDLTGGVYLLGNQNTKTLHFLRLPSHRDEKPHWNKIQVGRTIIDMGLCVYEHDLIAVVTTATVLTPAPQTNTEVMSYDIGLMLFEFSTGKPHPQAQKHTIHVMNTRWEKPAIGIEIVGDNLVLILFYHRHHARPDDRVFIFDWRTAVIKTNFSVPYDTYTGLIFLDENTILLPNTQTNNLDIFRIPSTPELDSTAHIPLVSLSLPQLSENRTVSGISCRSEPNPIGASSYLDKKKEARERADGPQEEDMFPKRGYLASAEEAICIFALRVVGGQQVANFQIGHTFTFIVHRNAINDVIYEFEQKRNVQEKLGADKVDLDPKSAESSTTTEAPLSDSPPSIPWKDWGPDITRWFNSDSIPTRWITTTAGQRCVLIADSAPETGFPYVVLDFNGENVRRMRLWQQARTLREKERERLARAHDREREIAETIELVKYSGRGAADGEAMNEGADDEGWYDHTGMAIVEDDELNGNGGPGVTTEVEDVVSNSAGPSAAGSSTAPALEGSDSGNELEFLLDPANEHLREDTQVTDDDAMDSEADWATEEEEDEDEGARRPSSVAPHEAGDETTDPSISLERDPNNPLEGSDNTAARRIWCVTTAEMVEPSDTFAEPVEGRLPYVACASSQTYAFHGVLLDEERIIGIRADFLDRIRQIEVHHFG